MANSKFELTKSIEARKLNPRTGIPTAEPLVPVPFGALIENVTPDRDRMRFTYLGQLLDCPEELFRTASAPVKKPNASAVPQDAPEPPKEPEPAATVPAAVRPESPSGPEPAVRLVWENLASNEGQCRRAKVPNGWLIAATFGGAAALTFYPDPDHGWDAAAAK